MLNFARPTGLWVPLITPFIDGIIDRTSLINLVEHYASKNIGGIILSATTGEGQLLSRNELEVLTNTCAEKIGKLNSSIPLFIGISGSDPVKCMEEIAASNAWQIDGVLVSGPNYLRPSQEGIFKYFECVASSTDNPVLIYNIPYRTGINIENTTMLELAKIPNIVGVKDCCANVEQSYELLRTAPDDFSVLTGEDPFFYNAMVHDAPGAILTGAHVLIDDHLRIMSAIKSGKQAKALEIWNRIRHIPGLLFEEPSPAPVKYWLWKAGMIESPEVRLPFVPLGNELAKRIDQAMGTL